MVKLRRAKEVVLRISIDEDDRCRFSVSRESDIETPPQSLPFAEGAFLNNGSRSWAPASAASSDRPGGAEATFEPDVDRFFYRWGGSLATVLAGLRARYGGDLDQFLIHLVFMLAELDGLNVAATARAKGAQSVVARRCELNMQSLSDITGIPRESVRRKLASLGAMNLVQRTEEGLFTAGPASDVRRFFYDLSPLFWAGAGGAGASAQAIHPQ